MILVIGGTGTVGSALVSELARREVRFRVLLRRPGRTELPPGAEPVAGDLARPQTLRPALEGVDAVFLLSPPAQDMETLLGNGIDEARRAGVRHVVKLSAIGAAPDAPFVLGRWHHATDAALARSGLGYTVLRPHMFMQNTLGFAPTIAAQGAFYAPLGDGRIPLIDARDIAAVAAAALLDEDDAHRDQTYTLTGPEALDYGTVAAQIAEAIGKPVRYVDVPPDTARQGMVASGMPEWMADDLIAMFTLFRTGYDELSAAVREVAGRRPRTFAAFARENAAVFRGEDA